MKTKKDEVLILVLVEYALRDSMKKAKFDFNGGLNPCFSGICAASY